VAAVVGVAGASVAVGVSTTTTRAGSGANGSQAAHRYTNNPKAISFKRGDGAFIDRIFFDV